MVQVCAVWYIQETVRQADLTYLCNPEETGNCLSGWIKCIQTCLKKLETVRVTGRNVSRLEPRSSGDQLLLFSQLVRRSREPRRVREPMSLALFLNWSKLLLLDLRSVTGHVTHVQKVVHCRGKGHPRTGHEGPEGEYSSTFSVTLALDGGGGTQWRSG